MQHELPPELVDALLDKLGSDDAFRELFQRDPRQALASLGHAPALDDRVAQGAWSCMAVSQLASKDVIRASRDALRRQLLTAQAGQSPITLEVRKA